MSQSNKGMDDGNSWMIEYDSSMVSISIHTDVAW